MSSVDEVSAQMHSDTLVDEFSLGLELLVQAFNDYIVNTIKLITYLSLTYHELID